MRRGRRWLVAICTLAVLLGGASVGVTSQEEQAEIRVLEMTCDALVYSAYWHRSSEPPPGCAALPGVPITVRDYAGALIAECVTDGVGRCNIPVAAGQTVLVTHDATVIPEAYRRPAEVPFVVRVSEGGWYEIFVENAGALTRGEAAVTGDARLTVHSRVCPTRYRADDPYGDCHDLPPDYAQAIRVSMAGVSRLEMTDGDGNAAFTDVPDGFATVELIGSPAIDDLIVFCSLTADPERRLPARALVDAGGVGGDVRFEVALLPGEDVLCDVYALPRVERRFAESDSGPLYDRAALRLVARVCALDVPAAERAERCTEPEALRPFSIETFATFDPAWVDVVTDGSGEAVVIFEYADIFRLRLERGGRYPADSVDCTAGDGAAVPVTLDAEGALIEAGSPGGRLQCTWYLVARG